MRHNTLMLLDAYIDLSYF